MTQYIYEVHREGARSSDLIGYYRTEEKAVEALTKSNMRISSDKPVSVRAAGRVTQIDLNDDAMPIEGELWDLKNHVEVWGRRVNWKGVSEYGWLDFRDEPVNDPDYQEFIRLRDKFGVIDPKRV